MNIGIYGMWGMMHFYQQAVPLKPGVVLVNAHGGGWPNESDWMLDVGQLSPTVVKNIHQAFPDSKLIVEVPVGPYHQQFLIGVDHSLVDYYWVGDEDEHDPNGLDVVKATMADIRTYDPGAKFYYSFGGEQTNSVWNPSSAWFQEIGAFLQVFRKGVDLVDMNFGYGCYDVFSIANNWQMLNQSYPGWNWWWTFSCQNPAHRNYHIQTAMEQLTRVGCLQALYFDFAPATPSYNQAWFPPLGDPACLVGYTGLPLEGFDLIKGLNDGTFWNGGGGSSLPNPLQGKFEGVMSLSY